LIADFIEPGDARWTRLLSRVRHDVFHLPHYLTLSANYEGGRPCAFYAEHGGQEFLAPLLIRDLPPELGAPSSWCDAITPYGYPTPLMTPSEDARDLEHFLRTFRDKAAELGIVTAFFRLHPLLELPRVALEPYGKLIQHGQTVFLDLNLTPELMWRQVRHDHREDINKLKRRGFRAVFDDWSRYDEFIAVYRSTMERVGADEFYFFSDAYFADLRAALGSALHLCAVLSPEGEFASGGLFTETGKTAQGFLAGTNPKYLRMAPAKLSIYSEALESKRLGNLVFHLGGGLGGRDDALFRSKTGFSRLRADFRTFRMIVLPDAFSTLLARAARVAQAPVDPHAERFPPYRNLSLRAQEPVTIS